MSLRNLPEKYLFDLLPEGVISLDQGGLIEAVVGGYQDRVADVRAFAGHFPDFVNPEADLPTLQANVVFAMVTTEAGKVVPVSLDFQADTPDVEDEDALRAWAASQLSVQSDRIGAVFAGIDSLRAVTVETLALLAANIGATLFTGLDQDATADELRTRAQHIVRAWFPALKVKGTAESFSVLGRLLGFADVAVTPLWTRLSPRSPSDIGSPDNDPDFAGKGDQIVSGQLPSPTYTPQEFFDGPFYAWQSPRLTPDPDSEDYYLTAVNRRNPFIRLLQLAGTVDNPPVGDYTLEGGGPNKRASVLLMAGTDDSNMAAEALAEGDGYNGMVIHVLDSFGTMREMAITDQLSLRKYRASWMNVAIGLTDAGSQTVQPNADLETDPNLIGTEAEAPYRPWSGGSRAFAVSTWPNPVVADLGVITQREQAPGSAEEVNPEVFQDAQRVAEALETVRPATRQIRFTGVGLFHRDDAIYAAFPHEAVMFSGDGPGSYNGTLESWQRPEGEFTASIVALAGTDPVPVYTELTNDLIAFAGDGFNGQFDQNSGIFDVTVDAGGFASSGTLTAEMMPVSTQIIRDEPPISAKESGTIGYQDRPEDFLDTSGTLQTYDDYPWRRPLLATGGDQVDANYYLPYIDDLAIIPSTKPAQARGVDGVMRSVYVLAAPPTPLPYRFKVVEPESIDETTGLPLGGPEHQPLLAVQDGTLYPVVWSDPAIISSELWNILQGDLGLWVPFNEHPVSRRTVRGRGYSALTVANLAWEQRVWDDDFGWTLELAVATNLAFQRGESAGTAFTIALWIKAAAGSGDQRLLNVADGILRLEVDGTAINLIHQLTDLQEVTLSAAIANDAWTLVVIRRDGDTLELGVGDQSTPVAFTSLTDDLLSEPATSDTVVTGGTVAVTVHNLVLWHAVKDDDRLEMLRVPPLARVQGECPTPWVETGAGDGRFGFGLLSSGFAYPEGLELYGKTWNPAYPQRYDGQGRYQGDPRFEQVGLGDGYRKLDSYTLGLQGAGVEGDGAVLITGSNPPLGWNDEFPTTLGQFIRVTGPYTDNGGVVSIGTESPTPSTVPSLQDTTNPAVSHVYVEGDTGTMYEVWLDDLGPGPALRAKPIVRPRPAREQALGVSPPFRDEPTDFESVLSIPGVILSVVDDGTTATPYAKSDGSVTRTSPPLYLYLNSIVEVDAPDAYLRWANPNADGQAVQTAMRETAGDLIFTNTEPLAAADYELVLDVGNIGTLDQDFPGFAVTVSLSTGMAGSLSQTTATLLRDGTGTNPTGQDKIVLRLTEAIAGSSVLVINWSNPLSIPYKGQKRQIAIFAYTLRLLSTSLYEVSLAPGLTLSAVDLDGTLPPGGLYGLVNSYGTIGELRHEADTYPDDSPWPLATLLTSSTVRRRELMRAVEPWQLPDPGEPLVPMLGTISMDGTLYQFGDTAELAVQVLAGTELRFAWEFYDGESIVTEGTEVEKVISAGTAPFTVEVTAVNTLGIADSVDGTIPVNEPPTVDLAAYPVFDVFPYEGTMAGTISDPESGALSSAFYENGVLLSSGTDLVITVDDPRDIVFRCVDDDGGVTERLVQFDGLPNQPPDVSPIMGPTEARLSTTAFVTFAVLAKDFENRGLTFLWTFWDSSTSSGLTTPVGYSTSYFNTVSFALLGSTQGLKTVTLLVTDGDGNTTQRTLNVSLLPNRVPVIVSVTSPVDSVLAGSSVPFEVIATDADGDVLSYEWTFSTPDATTILGAGILYPTTALQVGQSIVGTVTVNDGNGGMITQDAPAVSIRASKLDQVQPQYPPGFYTTGLNQSLTGPSGSIIRYSLDGTDLFSAADGLSYVGPFVMYPEGGAGVIRLKTRAFSPSPTVAASDLYDQEFTFFNPTGG